MLGKERYQRKILWLILVVLFLVLPSFCQTETKEPQNIAALRQQMLGLINQVRAKQNTGLGSLYLDDRLNSQAQAHSMDMSKRQFFSHTIPDGLGPQQRAVAAGFTYSVGENIAYNFINGRTMEEMVKLLHTGLMNSPPHFSNTIKSSWTRTGVGLALYGTSKMYVTVLFCSRDFELYPFTTQQMSTMKTQFETYMSTTNFASIPNALQPKVSLTLTEWLDSNRTLSYWSLLRKNVPNFNGASLNYNLFDYQPTGMQSMLARNSFLLPANHTFNRYGYDIRVSNRSIVNVYAGYTTVPVTSVSPS